MTSVLRIVERSVAPKRWTDRLSDRWHRWSALAAYLADVQRWPAAQVGSVSAESMRILAHMPDPMQAESFQGRGLVVGYVQSGKTANYTAVAARAADAGYRIVIVLSGIHDSLRNQTQRRLQRELVDFGPALSPAALPRPWLSLTSLTEDFQGPSVDSSASTTTTEGLAGRQRVPISSELPT